MSKADISESGRYVLAIETALGMTGVGVLDRDTGKAFIQTREDERGQAQFLVPMIQSVLEEADISFSDLGYIISTVGPGSFTGLRVGLSTARSLATSLELDVIGVNTLDLMAHGAVKGQGEGKTIHIVLETKRDDFYYRSYDFANNSISESQAISSDKIKDYLIDKKGIVVGNATQRLIDEMGQVDDVEVLALPFASIDTLLTFIDRPDFQVDASPIYLRGADVSKSKRTQRTLV